MDFYRPWQSRGVSLSTGSGSIISNNRIITNAHVVSNNTFIQVKKYGDSKKYTAKVTAIGHDCDLALLTVADEQFFVDTQPLDFGELPILQDGVTVIGYPQGGDKISITKGVVSRVEVTSYSQSARKLLTIQIDAAINPGNSGGPVIQDDKIVGIAMQTFKSGQNIGYMIPVPIIDHFFDDLQDGTYQGFPLLGIDYANTENASLRRLYGIEDYQGGVLITRMAPFSPAVNNLKEGDIIIAVDKMLIGSDGTFGFRKNERLDLPHLITIHQIDEDVHLRVVRNKKELELKVKLKKYDPLVPYPKHYDKPPYIIYGGMVFTVLTTDLLKSWGNAWWEKAPINLTYYLAGTGRLNFDSKKNLVVMLSVLPDELNAGYQRYGNSIISKINDKSFNSFKEFVTLLMKSKANEEFTIFESESNYKFIVSNENVDELSKDILNRNSIPSAFSQDVAQWLKPTIPDDTPNR